MRKYVPLKPGKKWVNRENKLRLLRQRSCNILLKITTLRFVFKQLSTERKKEGKEHEKNNFFFLFFFSYRVFYFLVFFEGACQFALINARIHAIALTLLLLVAFRF